jgi:copper(I)-binding protein
MKTRTFSTALLIAAIAIGSPGGAFGAQGLTVSRAWSRATPAGATTAAGFLTLSNHGQEDRLVGGSTAIATEMQIHEMTMEGGVMRMRPILGGLALPKGGVELKPGGLHIMFIGLKRPLAAGERFSATLQFQRAGAAPVEFVVAPIGSQSPP